MNSDDLRAACLALAGAVEERPFGDPDLAETLRVSYPADSYALVAR